MEITRENVAKLLDEREVNKPCHRCGNENFTLLEDFSNIIVTKKLDGGLVLGGPTVPVAIVACNKCGAITFHALGALGLLGGA